MNRHSKSYSSILVFVLVTLLAFMLLPLPVNPSREFTAANEYSLLPQQCCLEFNGTRAFTYLVDQCAFGSRPPGSSNLTACGDYIITSLENQGWGIQTQTWTHLDTPLRNIIAGNSSSPRYVLLAHYDTRPIADMDPYPPNQTQPILGANDGASGVAALLELASVLPEGAENVVTLLFVDAEDSGNWNGWEYIVGSTYYVNSLTDHQKNNIQAAVLLDMMGDADLQLKRELSSTSSLVDAIWQIAANLQYDDVFLDIPGYSIGDDHRPFLAAGIPAIDIVDFDYPPWHTLEDTPDKCSPESLEAVGRVVEDFVQQQLVAPTIFRVTDPWILPLFFALIVLVIVVIILILLVFWRKRQHID
ncbi:MAG: M28 family peptidase [Candidatus Hermodarchaeia archaeon]|jgi:hypothetical protein